MIEDAINRLAAAIEAQNVIQAENQRLFAELVAAGKPVTPASAVIIEAAPEPEPEPKIEQKIERKARKAPEKTSVEPEPEPEPETNIRPVSRKDLTDFALSLSRQNFGVTGQIKAIVVKHGSPTITALAEDKIGIVFAELNNLAQELARETEGA